MNYENAGEALSYEIAFAAVSLEKDDITISDRANLTSSLIYRTQAIAIMVLLARADAGKFQENLVQAANYRLDFLNYIESHDLDGVYHHCAGRIDGLLTALAANDIDLAKNISSKTPTDLREQMEYVDDYCYARSVACLIERQDSSEQLQELLSKLEDYCEIKNARYSIIEALMNRADRQFHLAFLELIDERGIELEEKRLDGEFEEPEVLAHRDVFIEGLALLNLAEYLGLKVIDVYKYCPRLARVAVR